MAISTNSKVQITLVMSAANQTMMNVWSYNVLELVGTPTAAHYGEAWWNHVKGGYRALATADFGAVFKSVRVVELGNSLGEYGEFPVPTGEQTGTRANPTDADTEPLLLAAGVRMTVPSRLTRPGQKRFTFLTQTDTLNQVLSAGFKALLSTLMTTMTTNMTLGAPAAGVVLVPNIVSLNSDGTIRAAQGVSGFVVGNNPTSQVTRKIGRGM